MYGGFGDDLLNADDDLTTDGGKNDATDTGVSYQDIAYGGGGRDTLIGNTGGDRLIDWVGEFNAYIVPFAPFGAATVSRDVAPQMYQYLYNLSAGDGADNTFTDGAGRRRHTQRRAVRRTRARYSGRLYTRSRTGRPRPERPISRRPAICRAARATCCARPTFTNGQMNGVLPVSGTWTVSKNAMNATPTSVGTSSFAVFDVNDYLPNYLRGDGVGDGR